VKFSRIDWCAMNKSRRKKIEQALDLLREAAEEERDAFDNLPDSLRDAERGQKMEEAADALDEVVSSLEEVLC
jgi:hypothetical protein